MDLKGITWVGNTYHKFETLCLEVEETMYQDTVKYVEDQVQTVGASVKKFYSDVLQDILPPSLADPLKLQDSGLPMKQLADTMPYKKPKVRVKEEQLKVDVMESIENQLVISKVKNVRPTPTSTTKAPCRVNPLLPPYENPSNDCYDLVLSKTNGRCVYKDSNKDIMEKSKWGNYHISEMSEGSSRASSLYEFKNRSHEAATDQTDFISRIKSNDVMTCHSEENNNQCIAINDFIADETKHAVNSSNSIQLSADMPLSNGAGNLNSIHNGSVDMEHFMSKTYNSESDGWNIEAIESFDGNQSGDRIIDLDKMKLDESCVIVDAENLHSVSRGKGIHKSYKKKIHDVLSPRLKSQRKHEYEQLASLYGGTDKGCNQRSLVPTPIRDSREKELRTEDSCEYEWELL